MVGLYISICKDSCSIGQLARTYLLISSWTIYRLSRMSIRSILRHPISSSQPNLPLNIPPIDRYSLEPQNCGIATMSCHWVYLSRFFCKDKRVIQLLNLSFLLYLIIRRLVNKFINMRINLIKLKFVELIEEVVSLLLILSYWYD